MENLQEPGAARSATAELAEPQAAAAAGELARQPAPATFWKVLGGGLMVLFVVYALFTFARLEIFKMLLTSFFPLAIMILAVLGTIVFGLATPTEAAAVGSFGGFVLAAFYLAHNKSQEKRRSFRATWIRVVAPASTFASTRPIALITLCGIASIASIAVTRIVGWTSVQAHTPQKQSKIRDVDRLPRL